MADKTKRESSKKTASSSKGAHTAAKSPKNPKKKNTNKKTVRKSTTAVAERMPAPPKAIGPNIAARRICALCFCFVALCCFIGFFASAWLIDFVRNLLRGLIGWGFYLAPFTLLVAAYMLFRYTDRPVRLRCVCVLMIPAVVSSIIHIFKNKALGFETEKLVGLLYSGGKSGESGGLISGLFAVSLKAMITSVGAVILLAALLTGVVFIAFRLTPAMAINALRSAFSKIYDMVYAKSEEASDEEASDYVYDENIVPTAETETVKKTRKSARVKSEQTVSEETAAEPSSSDVRNRDREVVQQPVYTDFSRMPETVQGDTDDTEELDDDVIIEQVAEEIEEGLEQKRPAYSYPPYELLEYANDADTAGGQAEIKRNVAKLNETLLSFGINSTIESAMRGPAVTRYDIELERGVKLSKITGLADDIALTLGVSGVRIAPVPDKSSTVGIEVPNKIVSTVSLREVIESPQFVNSKSKLSFALGKNISGECVVGDISKLPHMLIAGTTGSGKSVCMNSIILSLIYKSTPDDVRFIMIDPKMIELGIYNGIPHLLIPVVTDPKKASGALQWAVTEMMKRYRLFSETNTRDLAGYNAVCENDTEREKLPRIVIVIDELADLMLVAAKEVEESICRIAQMARAAGMHLLIATQRPSSDVITGLMKANIPSRIAFAVSSSLESRIILDNSGAEKLVGHGDMLFLPLGAGKATRIQGTFVSDDEREQVISFVKRAGTPDYSSEIITEIERNAEGKPAAVENEPENAGRDDDLDELYDDAVEVVLECGQCSVSMLQRRLKLGYARAARIVDQMEDNGIVGPFEGSKPRAVLITRDDWTEKKLFNSPDRAFAEPAEAEQLEMIPSDDAARE